MMKQKICEHVSIDNRKLNIMLKSVIINSYFQKYENWYKFIKVVL